MGLEFVQNDQAPCKKDLASRRINFVKSGAFGNNTQSGWRKNSPRKFSTVDGYASQHYVIGCDFEGIIKEILVLGFRKGFESSILLFE